MEKYTLNDDMNIMYVTAHSFPDGIMEAFDRVRKQVTVEDKRPVFGISHMGADGKVIYKAGVLEKEEGEAEKYGCERFIMEKGEYLSRNIENRKQNIPLIGSTFQEMIRQPNVDPQGACIEWYSEDNKELLCLVKLAD